MTTCHHCGKYVVVDELFFDDKDEPICENCKKGETKIERKKWSDKEINIKQVFTFLDVNYVFRVDWKIEDNGRGE